MYRITHTPTGQTITTTIDTIVDDAMNDAILSIQNALGITTGDYAGVHFSGEAGDTLRSVLRDYAESEGAFAQDSAPLIPFHALRIGDRVRLRYDVQRYPHFQATLGMTGTVQTIERDNGDLRHLYVKMDDTLADCEEWDNCIVWTFPEDDHEHDALTRI